MSQRSPEEVVRQFYRFWETKDRAAVDAAVTDSFRFSSPRDDRIDKATYLTRCWPNADVIASFDLEHVAADGDCVFVQYVATRRADGTRFRNTEVFRVAGERIDEVNVFFGRDLDERKG